MSLVLTRRPGERIFITNTRNGERITLTLGETRGNQTRLLIGAPLHYHIVREELDPLPVGDFNDR